MLKKVLCVLAACVVALALLTSCSISNGDGDIVSSVTAPTAEVTTTKPELFNGRIPDYEFEHYVDSVDTETTYTFNVQCSREEYDEYLQMLINCGFVNSTTQSETDFYGETSSGYTVSANYLGETLLVYFTK